MSKQEVIKTKKKYWFFVALFVFLSLFALDQIFKLLVVRSIKQGEMIGSSMFNISHFRNTGIAFSIPFKVEVLYVLVFGLLVALLWYYRKQLRSGLILLSLIFIFAGAFSNLFDRIARGAVIDYLGVFFWPTFNFADVLIMVGVGTLLLKELVFKGKKELSTSDKYL